MKSQDLTDITGMKIDDVVPYYVDLNSMNNEQKKREPGYYWVKESHTGVWSIAQYGDGALQWDMFGCENSVDDDYFLEIGDRITHEEPPTVEGDYKLESPICVNSSRQYPWIATFLAKDGQESCECGMCKVRVISGGHPFLVDGDRYKELFIREESTAQEPAGEPQEELWREVAGEIPDVECYLDYPKYMNRLTSKFHITRKQE